MAPLWRVGVCAAVAVTFLGGAEIRIDSATAASLCTTNQTDFPACVKHVTEVQSPTLEGYSSGMKMTGCERARYQWKRATL